MPPTRRRRIVRRAVMALGGCVLLVWLYLSSYFMMWWGVGSGVVPLDVKRQLEVTLYAPLECYIDDGRPGGKELKRLRNWVCNFDHDMRH
jgi:hypothetical protein